MRLFYKRKNILSLTTALTIVASNMNMVSALENESTQNNISGIETASNKAKSASRATVSTYKVTTDVLNVRKGPSTSYARIGKVYKGDTLKVHSISNNWARITYNNTTNAYVNTTYIQKVTTTISSSNTSSNTSNNTKTTATITGDVWLRQNANWSSKQLMVLKKNVVPTYLGTYGDWYKVSYAGKTGYVTKKYVTLKTVTTNTNVNNSSSSSTQAGKATIKADTYIRQSKNWSSTKLVLVKKGVAVDYLGTEGSWVKAKYNNQTGYISKDYITVTSSSNSTNQNNSNNSNSNNQSSNVAVIKEATYIRQSKNWSSTKLILVNKGVSVNYLATEGDWIKVTHNNKTGYIHKNYITLNVKEEEKETIQTSTVKYIVNTASLNVRSGAGTNNSIIGTVKEKTVIEVYSINGDWAKIKYNNEVGYVHKNYIIKQDSQSTTTPNKNNSNKTIFIDAGHGGTDPGAIGKVWYTKEKDAVLDVTKKVLTKLQQKGYKTAYSRNTDVYIPLAQRTAKAKEANATIFVSMHFNSASATSAAGIETLYRPDGRNSNVLAKEVQDELIGATGLKNRGLKSRTDLYVLNNSSMPAILIEGGFLSNRSDESFIKSEAYREKLANAIVKGIDNYFN